MDVDEEAAPKKTRGVARLIMPQRECDFAGIKKKMLRDGLENIPVVVKVAERVMRHYTSDGEHVTKDEANRLAGGLAYYVNDDGSTDGSKPCDRSQSSLWPPFFAG